MHYSLFLPYLRRYWLNHRKTFKANKIKYLSLIVSLRFEMCCHKVSLRSSLCQLGVSLCSAASNPSSPAQKARLFHGNWEGEEEILQASSCLPEIPAADDYWSQDLRVSGVFVSSNRVMFSWCYHHHHHQPQKWLHIIYKMFWFLMKLYICWNSLMLF